MPTYDVFSKRRKGKPSALVYDVIPPALRAQLQMVFADAFGMWMEGFALVDSVIRREHPVPTFEPIRGDRYTVPPAYFYQCIRSGDLDECLDAVEIALGTLNVVARQQPNHHSMVYQIKQSVDDAVVEVNERLLEHGIGYQFSVHENQIVRLDSRFVYGEVVEPAIQLLQSPGFEGPAQEFAQAHAFHRAGEGKDAIAWAVKALESTAKAICDARGWSYAKTDAAKKLLDILFEKELIPNELEAHFGGLRSALVSGLPTIGNALARHGQGARVKPIAAELVNFGMHLCAAAIVFLVEAHSKSR